jgi:hypothetical protein
VHPPRKLHVGERAVALKMVQDPQIDAVKLHEVLLLNMLAASYAA